MSKKEQRNDACCSLFNCQSTKISAALYHIPYEKKKLEKIVDFKREENNKFVRALK